jgi:hypothetical protein
MSSGIYIYISTIISFHQLSKSGLEYGCIWERCGALTELERKVAVMNILPHVSRHPKGIDQKERFWLQEPWERVRGCNRLPSGKEQHKLHGSMN